MKLVLVILLAWLPIKVSICLAADSDVMVIVPGNPTQKAEESKRHAKYENTFTNECRKDNKKDIFCKCLVK